MQTVLAGTASLQCAEHLTPGWQQGHSCPVFGGPLLSMLMLLLKS